MRNPLLLPLVAVAAGVALARSLPFTAAEALAPAAALALLAAIAWRCASGRYALACLSISLVFAGSWLAVVHDPGAPPALNAESGETILLTGCVVEPPAIRDDREQFTLELAADARARVTLKEPAPALRYGQWVEVPARVRYPRNFRNPGAFDYVGYLARRQTYWNASGSAAELKILGGRCGSRVWAVIYGLRTAALDRIAQLYRGDAYKTGILQALLIGDATRVEKLWTEDFRRTGTYHALVISGLHISVLAGTLLLLTRLCFIPNAVALPLTAGLAWLYALVAGAQAPVIRSAAGFTLFLVARWFYRRGRILNLLAAVALLFLVLDPEQMFEASFQLSFLSVAAIGALAAPLIESTSQMLLHAARGLHEEGRDVHFEPRTAAVRLELRLLAETISLQFRIPPAWAARAVSAFVRVGAFIFDSAVVSVCVQIGLALPMILYFHRLSISGLSANLVVVPLLNTAVLIGFVALFTGWAWIASAVGALVEWARAVVDWHARWEPNWRVADPPVWLALAFVAALLAVGFATRFRRTSFALVLALLSASCVYTAKPGEQPLLQVTAIDVGQGDSLFVRFPNGKRMLVDGGGIPTFGHMKKPALDIGEDVVSAYLWSQGIRSVDVIVSTHGHEDHSGGLRALVENFHPREIWMGASPGALPFRAQPLTVRRLRAGNPFAFGGATIQVFAPTAAYEPEVTAKNNDSVALLISYMEHRFLLTGDIERQVEWQIVDGGRLPPVDVLKIAHHGSRTSSTDEFLDVARPRIALLSVGTDNLYRLPHQEVIERFERRHTAVLRTDRLGLSTVVSDGKRLSFTCEQWERPARGRYTPF